MLVLALWYLLSRIGSRLSISLMLFAILLAIHGLPLLVYLYVTGPDTFIYEAALAPVNRTEVLTRLVWAITLMFAFVILGSELAATAFNAQFQRGHAALRQQVPGLLHRTVYLHPIVRMVLWITAVAMLVISVLESQPSKLIEYFAAGESEVGRLLLRQESGGTPYYLYNVVLYSVAPYLVMVAYCDDNGARRFPLLAAALFAAVILGKFGTLSKAPPVIFMLQLVLLHLLLRRRSINLSTATLLVCSALVMFLTIVHLTIPDLDLVSAASFLYYRIFDIPNEVLVEYFAAIPASLRHGGGAGIFAFLRDGPASDYIPMYSAVAEITRASLDSTSNVMFVGDAWAEFGWFGVVTFSLLAGAIARAIDICAMRLGESDGAACLIAGCSFGVVTALSTALTTALITGGLALLPLLSMMTTRRTQSRSQSAHPRAASIEASPQ